jgi:hypothetical protein
MPYLGILGTSAIDRHRKAEFGDNVLQPGNATSHWFQEVQLQVRPGYCERYARQTCTRTDVEHPAASRHKFPEDSGIEQVPIPQPIRFPRTDDSSFDPGAGKHVGVPCGELVSITECRVRRRCRMFHVKPSRSAHSAGKTTTRRCGSSPSLSLCTPSTAATASCTIFRSKGVIGCSLIGAPLSRTRCGPTQRGEVAPPGGPPLRDVEHQPATRAGLLLHCQPGEFLERLQHHAARAYQFRQIVPAIDTHHGAAGLDVQINVAVVVHEIEQPLKIVARYVTFLDEKLLVRRLSRLPS